MTIQTVLRTNWDPDQYRKFANQRMRAAVELLQRVPLVSPTTIADLGCGAGDVTRLIANHWPSATVIGVDSSQEMLEPAHIWETEYHQIFDGTDAVLEWARGTSLRPILQQLDDRELRQFLDTYRTRLREAYPTTPGGTLHRFRRLFIVVCK